MGQSLTELQETLKYFMTTYRINVQNQNFSADLWITVSLFAKQI